MKPDSPSAAPLSADPIRGIVLAYSGGLDTSVILAWLQEKYACEIITFTADLGAQEDLEAARAKAQKLGVQRVFVEDLREDFVRDYVFPMLRANPLYEGAYLLGTAIARPLITLRLVRIAQASGANAIAHGATGKGNDQVRFELGAAALDPGLRVIAPWREWELHSRKELLAYAERRNIPIEGQRQGGSPYSVDANLLHTSYEGGPLEDPWQAPEEQMWKRTTSPLEAPDRPEILEVEFQNGDPVAVNGESCSPAVLLTKLNELGGRHGIGRVDLVENRYIGMKSRGCYETPGGTLLLKARRAVESLTLDRELAHLKDECMPRYVELIYNGYWWSPERLALQKLVDSGREHVNGTARLQIYKGHITLLGRRSRRHSLYRPELASFEESGGYKQADAAGFLRVASLRLRHGHKQKD